jgi:thymidine phosphorylase
MRPARLRREVRTVSDGYVQSVAALDVALAALHLGAGRTRAEDPVDHAVGFTRLIKVGARVTSGDLLAVIHANDETKANQAGAMLQKAIVIGGRRPEPTSLVIGRV